LFLMDTPATAHTHYTQSMTHYYAQQHRSSMSLPWDGNGVLCVSRAAWVLWYLGYADQAARRSHEAVTLAQQMAHPFRHATALSAVVMFHQFRREMRATQEHAEALISLTTVQGFPFWLAFGSLMRGWALTHQGQGKKGIEQMTQGLRAYRATGAELFQSYALTLLAEAYGTIEEPEEGLAVLTEALKLVDTTGERWYESEIYRLKGALLLQQSADNQAEAERCFHQAIAIAQSQSAKSFELRAATNLAKLWQRQGKRHEAYDLLAPVYSWFTEGFDTADLQDAKTLLDALEKRRS
jgi:predicted ATPase